MDLHVPIGIDDFRTLRERGLVYVDKSHLVRELIDDTGVTTVLLPRPRRFGKSLNLSMLRCFFEKRAEDFSPLFEGLSIATAGEAYRRHFQRYPVIHLTFKGINPLGWDHVLATIRQKIADVFREHAAVLDGGRLAPSEARDYQAILDGTASPVLYERALLNLSRYLHRHHGEPVVVLIDEYDAPIHGAYVDGYAREVVAFFRSFLGEGLKGNPHVWKGVLTGILRVARESIFSELNNLAVYSILRPEMSDCCGFTEPEVTALLSRAGLADRLADVRGWYNGYRFGDAVVYNPWSILNYVGSRDHLLRNYWVNTSSNELVRDLLRRHALHLEPLLETLLAGGSLTRQVDDHVVLADLGTNVEALFGLLLFTGYLKAEPLLDETMTEGLYRLSIPNREVRAVYASTFRTWLQDRIRGGELGIDRLKTALFSGDAAGLQEALEGFTTCVLSYHDLAARKQLGSDAVPPSAPLVPLPEQVLHAFVLGLLATLEPAYEVRSNRESGSGRPDVMIRPRTPGQPGVLLELKVARAGVRTAEAALRAGAAQVRARGYAAELLAAGAAPIHAFVVAFDGKRVRACTVDLTAKKKAPRPRAKVGRTAPKTPRKKRA
jgi:hypothetical protein